MSANPNSLVWTSASQSHVGAVRSLNEDAFLDETSMGLWVVADGMGGHEAGDFASRSIVESLGQITINSESDSEDFAHSVVQQLRAVNQMLRREAASKYENRTIGSTVVTLLARERRARCLWVGDSRLYRLRAQRLEQISRDHSHVQDLVDQRLITPEQARDHPLGNIITRAIGSEETLAVEQLAFEVWPGDYYLLCSDGLNRMLTDEELQQIMVSQNSERAMVREMVQTALERGASDNVTIIIARSHHPEAYIEEDDDEDATVIVEETAAALASHHRD